VCVVIAYQLKQCRAEGSRDRDVVLAEAETPGDRDEPPASWLIEKVLTADFEYVTAG
jgi:hypothetical protein